LLHLPINSPNYALLLETNLVEGHFYTFELHLKYLSKILFEYDSQRLPNKLANKLLQQEVFWAEQLKNYASKVGVGWTFENLTADIWRYQCSVLLAAMKEQSYIDRVIKARTSNSRVYRNLRLLDFEAYFAEDIDVYSSALVFKARCDLLGLNGNRFEPNAIRLCSLCNMDANENCQHFVGICPALKDFRLRWFGKSYLNEEETLAALNGDNDPKWKKLIGYLRSALAFRKLLAEEFNF